MRFFAFSGAISLSFLLFAGVAAPASNSRPDPQVTARAADKSLAAEVLKPGVDVAPKCDDATFLRRAWLDIVGDIPTPEDVTEFLFDNSPDKRTKLVRELLADPQYGLNWARYW